MPTWTATLSSLPQLVGVREPLDEGDPLLGGCLQLIFSFVLCCNKFFPRGPLRPGGCPRAGVVEWWSALGQWSRLVACCPSLWLASDLVRMLPGTLPGVGPTLSSRLDFRVWAERAPVGGPLPNPCQGRVSQALSIYAQPGPCVVPTGQQEDKSQLNSVPPGTTQCTCAAWGLQWVEQQTEGQRPGVQGEGGDWGCNG